MVPIYSSTPTIQPGSWISIFGTNLASSQVIWNNDFPTTLGGTRVTINNKPGYLWLVSPTQINMQAPDDTTTGKVNVVVTTPNGSATTTVTLAAFGPSFSVLDGKHVAGILLRSDGSGAYGGGTYDIVGPTGSSLGYRTVAARPGDTLELFGVGFGPTNPAVSSGQAFSGAAQTTNSIQLQINGNAVTPIYSGLSSAGLYQINVVIPSNLGTGDVPLVATVGGVQTPSGVVLSLQNGSPAPQIQSLTLYPTAVTAGSNVQGVLALTGPAPSSGATVNLASSLPSVTVPGNVVIPAGVPGATFTIATAAVTTNQTATVTATYAGSSQQATVTLVPSQGKPAFSTLSAVLGFQANGGSSGQFPISITPDAGNATYTAASGTNIVFPAGVPSNGNQTFTFNAVGAGSGGVANFVWGGNSIKVTSATMVLNLTQNSSGNGIAQGVLSGTLSVTGTPYPSGGPSQTFTGTVGGTYTAVQ